MWVVFLLLEDPSGTQLVWLFMVSLFVERYNFDNRNKKEDALPINEDENDEAEPEAEPLVGNKSPQHLLNSS